MSFNTTTIFPDSDSRDKTSILKGIDKPLMTGDVGVRHVLQPPHGLLRGSKCFLDCFMVVLQKRHLFY